MSSFLSQIESLTLKEVTLNNLTSIGLSTLVTQAVFCQGSYLEETKEKWFPFL